MRNTIKIPQGAVIDLLRHPDPYVREAVEAVDKKVTSENLRAQSRQELEAQVRELRELVQDLEEIIAETI